MHKLLGAFDTRLTSFIQRWPSWVRPYMISASVVGLPVVTISTSVLIALLGLINKSGTLFYAGVFAMMTLGVGTVLKMTLRRRRPLTDYVLAMKRKSFSFPSGHSLGSVVSFGLVAYLLGGMGIFGAVMILAVILLCFLIGISRVYLGAHYPSDVIAGWLFGLLALAILVEGIRPSL